MIGLYCTNRDRWSIERYDMDISRVRPTLKEAYEEMCSRVPYYKKVKPRAYVVDTETRRVFWEVPFAETIKE